MQHLMLIGTTHGDARLWLAMNRWGNLYFYFDALFLIH
jgi:hypothetical protein